jgi:hypothetical protein
MNARAQFERLISQVEQHGALMDKVAGASNRISPGLAYPRLFSQLVTQHSFAALDVCGVRIYSNIRGDEDNIEDLLADKILTRSLVGAGFLPFGRPATGHYDPVCFDMRGVKHPLDAPVVMMDHEAILSRNRIPKPWKLADGIVQLFEAERLKIAPVALPNNASAEPRGSSEASRRSRHR